MKLNSANHKLSALLAKGGIMLFTVERPDIIYKGSIILSPLQGCYQKRAVHINKYRYYGQNQDNKGGTE